MQIALEQEQPRLGQAAHPSERELAGFMRGTASREEAKTVVRHLLTRCQTCLELTMRLWCLGDRAPTKKIAPTPWNHREVKPVREGALREEGGPKP
jgi:hypothetical protein